MEELFDVHQAAAYLGGVSRATVYREVQRKKLAIVKVRGSTRFRRSDLDRYLRERTTA